MAKEQNRTDPKLGATDAEVDAALSLARSADANERIAAALERLADAFAPARLLRSVPGTAGRRACPVGHGMQVDDTYCQACEREKRNPKPAPGNDAA